MKKHPTIVLALLLLAGIAAFYLNGYMNRNVVVLNSGTVFFVDRTWDSSDVIFYEVENETFVINKSEVKSFGKPDFEIAAAHLRFIISRLSTKTHAQFNDFA